MGQNREIGRNNDLLLHLPEDLKWFKNKTKGHIVIMGSKTYESLPNGPLPYRDNIVITRKGLTHPDLTVVSSIEEALKTAKNRQEGKEIFIIGGSSIYEQFMEHAQRLYITHIFESFPDCDKYFPVIDSSWNLVKLEGDRENIENLHPHVFATYEKKF